MSRTAAFVAGQALGAGDLNPLLAAWDTFTPTLVNATLGNGVLHGRSYQQGKTVAVRILLTPGSSTTYTGASLAFTLPVPASASDEQDLLCKFWNTSLNYTGFGYINPAAPTTITPYVPISSTNCSLNSIYTGSGISIPAGSTMTLQGTYEAA